MIVYRWSAILVKIEIIEADYITDSRVGSKTFEENRYGMNHGYEESYDLALIGLTKEIQEREAEAAADHANAVAKTAKLRLLTLKSNTNA